MVERDVRRDARRQQLVNEPVVEVEALLVDAARGPACREDARPSDAEAIVLQAHGLHEGNVGVHHAVVVTRNVACRPLGCHRWVDGAWRVAAAMAAIGARHAHRVGASEGVPDGGSAAVLPVGPLHLVGGRPHAPNETRGEGAAVLVILRPLTEGIGHGVCVIAALQFQAHLVANVRPGRRGCGRCRSWGRCGGRARRLLPDGRGRLLLRAAVVARALGAEDHHARDEQQCQPSYH
mmetsp:Transcript_34014/g.108161  ORF Transcript_34014/g.108161 Transcript_34014/m.108161 type:complete len:236 (+) Transcript_34014:1685-2392(+)